MSTKPLRAGSVEVCCSECTLLLVARLYVKVGKLQAAQSFYSTSCQVLVRLQTCSRPVAVATATTLLAVANLHGLLTATCQQCPSLYACVPLLTTGFGLVAVLFPLSSVVLTAAAAACANMATNMTQSRNTE
jgi:hypothetical protein